MGKSSREIVENVKQNNREFIAYDDGSQWTRRLDPKTGKPLGDWKIVESLDNQSATEATLKLAVVVQKQSEGEPYHWALFCYYPDQTGKGKGQVWQVKGDAECMRYQHASNIDIFNSASFYWHQVVSPNLSHAQYGIIDKITRDEQPPRAANRAAVKENCQGWTIRVLRRLVRHGIVEERTVTMLQGYMDPL
jgi:hypothetical protein